MTSRYTGGPVHGRYRGRGMSAGSATDQSIVLKLRVQKRSWRRCKRCLLRLVRQVQQLAPEIARQFFNQRDTCAEMMRVDFVRGAAGPAGRFVAAFHLTDRYFDALAAVRTGDVDYFAVQVGSAMHGRPR